MIFPLLFVLAGPLAGAALPDYQDWIGPESPAYAVLRKAADEAGLQGWEASFLKEGKSLPQASARTLADSLRRDPAVDAETKLNLATTLPSEVMAAKAKSAASLDEAKAKLAAIDLRLAELNATQAINNYSPSTPLGLVTTYNSGYEIHAFSGLSTQNFSETPILLNGEFQGQSSIGSYKFFLQYFSQNQDQGQGSAPGTYPFTGSHVSLLTSPFGFSNVQIDLGFSSLLLSKLIYAAPAYPYESPFYKEGAKLTVGRADSPNGERDSQGIYIRKQGSQGYWIFNDFQFFAAPEAEAYEGFNHHHSYEIGARADLPGIGFIPGTESTVPYFTYYFHGNDASQLGTFTNNNGFYDQPVDYPEQSSNEAFGFESQLNGGGTLIFEMASASASDQISESYPSLKDSSLNGLAYYANLTKSMGRVILGLQASQIDPSFVPGGHNINSQQNIDSGMALDTLLFRDYRNGAKDSSWTTVSEDQAWLTNNSQRAALQASWLDSWGSFGFSLASSRQIEPSGPWVQGANAFNNSPYNGFSYFQLFFENYTYSPTGGTPATGTSPALVAYNAPTTSQALVNGAPVNSPYNPNGLVRWNDLEQLAWRNVTQTIWLSKHGVGDPNLMDDSIKVYNSFRADLSLELGSIFGSSRKAHLQVFEEIRDTAQGMRLALGAQPDLLLQQITGTDLIWQFAPTWEAVATAGHESWATNASYYPVNFSDDTAGIGFNALLTKLVDGLEVNFRLLYMQHQDQVFSQRDFSGTMASLGANYKFSN